MRKLLFGFMALGMLMCSVNSAVAGVSIGIGIGLPNVSIGINLPLYPELVAVPGYPVYYAPRVDGNYFFYDGMYWVYQNDNWYASSWYNGPWGFVDPFYVPLYVLRVPVSYYRQPPRYFSGWASNAPPRWGQHWGHSWEQRRSGWDRWNRSSAPRPAPLPTYQRQYAGDRYPRVEQQKALRTQNYRYQPREKVVNQHFKQAAQKAPAAQHVKQERPQQHAPAAREQRQQPAAAQPQQQRQLQQQRQQQEQQHQQKPQQSQQRQQQQPQQQQEQQQRGPQGHDQQQGHEQRGGGQDHGQGQNGEEGRGR